MDLGKNFANLARLGEGGKSALSADSQLDGASRHLAEVDACDVSVGLGPLSGLRDDAHQDVEIVEHLLPIYPELVEGLRLVDGERVRAPQQLGVALLQRAIAHLIATRFRQVEFLLARNIVQRDVERLKLAKRRMKEN